MIKSDCLQEDQNRDVYVYEDFEILVQFSILSTPLYLKKNKSERIIYRSKSILMTLIHLITLQFWCEYLFRTCVREPEPQCDF